MKPILCLHERHEFYDPIFFASHLNFLLFFPGKKETTKLDHVEDKVFTLLSTLVQIWSHTMSHQRFIHIFH